MANQPELKVQIAIIKWLRAVMPKALIQHSRNEVQKRGPSGMREVVRAKSAGMLPGFPDLIVLPDAKTGPFFLEVKAPKGRVSPTQEQVHGMLSERGYPIAVVKSVEDTREFLIGAGIPFNEVAL
ncbi:VRR-NUC domain-containing protein [Yoonia sp. R2331]|uniref:VRR-NUC domain-containing protein n=1 Tax=Yoonia sp. R2331 TaxID=3237238 RepID=UPI0034E3A932